MKVIRTIVLTCLGALLPTAAVGQTIVWTDQDARRIQKKAVNGGEVETIVQFPSSPAATQIHYDPIAAKLYYRRGTAFQRINLDGSAPEIIPTPSAGGFTLNVDSRKLYWVYSGSIYRSELDGTGVHSHAYPTCCLGPLEAFGDELFFGAAGMMSKGVWRADAGGANAQFLHVTSQPMDLAYDPVDKKLYIAAIDAIFRMNLDGTAFETFLKLPQWLALESGPEEVVVDSRARKVYWGDRTAKVIQRSNLDGSNVEDFVTVSDVANPNLEIAGLTIVYNSTPIPTLSGWGLTVMAAALLGIGLLVLSKIDSDAALFRKALATFESSDYAHCDAKGFIKLSWLTSIGRSFVEDGDGGVVETGCPLGSDVRADQRESSRRLVPASV